MNSDRTLAVCPISCEYMLLSQKRELAHTKPQEGVRSDGHVHFVSVSPRFLVVCSGQTWRRTSRTSWTVCARISCVFCVLVLQSLRLAGCIAQTAPTGVISVITNDGKHIVVRLLCIRCEYVACMQRFLLQG